jgi:uncharacterized membrane protein
MHFAGLAFLSGPRILLQEFYPHTLQLMLRWIHFVAGITWVGLLYFFNLVNTPFFKELGPADRVKIIPMLMPRAMAWFRWSSVVTVLAGIWYWMMIVSADAHNAQTSGGRAIGTFFGVWTIAFIIEMALLMAPPAFLRQPAVFGGLIGISLVAAARTYLNLNWHGWESNRLLAIGIGGGLGWFMMLNVWGIVWRAQKKIIRWARENPTASTPMPADLARFAAAAQLAAQTNFVLSLPMLLMMAVASHYPVFGP